MTPEREKEIREREKKIREKLETLKGNQEAGLGEYRLGLTLEDASAIFAEIDRLRSELEKAHHEISVYDGERDEARTMNRALQISVAELRQEIKVLRQFGNKDCTAMADEELAKIGGEKC